MIPTSSFIVSCRSFWIVYGFSPPSSSWFANGASAASAADFTSSSDTVGRLPLSFCALYAALWPARRPNTSRSDSEFPPSLFDPCMPPATSPAA